MCIVNQRSEEVLSLSHQQTSLARILKCFNYSPLIYILRTMNSNLVIPILHAGIGSLADDMAQYIHLA